MPLKALKIRTMAAELYMIFKSRFNFAYFGTLKCFSLSYVMYAHSFELQWKKKIFTCSTMNFSMNKFFNFQNSNILAILKRKLNWLTPTYLQNIITNYTIIFILSISMNICNVGMYIIICYHTGKCYSHRNWCMLKMHIYLQTCFHTHWLFHWLHLVQLLHWFHSLIHTFILCFFRKFSIYDFKSPYKNWRLIRIVFHVHQKKRCSPEIASNNLHQLEVDFSGQYMRLIDQISQKSRSFNYMFHYSLILMKIFGHTAVF